MILGKKIVLYIEEMKYKTNQFYLLSIVIKTNKLNVCKLLSKSSSQLFNDDFKEEKNIISILIGPKLT